MTDSVMVRAAPVRDRGRLCAMSDGPSGYAATSSILSVHWQEFSENLDAGHDGFQLPTFDSKHPRRDSRRDNRCNKGRIPGSDAQRNPLRLS